MTRLIDAEFLASELRKWRDKDPHRKNRSLIERWVRKEGINVLIRVVDAFPSIPYEPVKHGRWIPVTERLPEEDGDLYIVTAYNEEIWWNRVVVVTAEYYRGNWTWNENGREWDLTDSVTHWMPLPEPPKTDGGADNED